MFSGVFTASMVSFGTLIEYDIDCFIFTQSVSYSTFDLYCLAFNNTILPSSRLSNGFLTSKLRFLLVSLHELEV